MSGPGRLAYRQHWLRIRTDWLSDPRLIVACRLAKTPVAALAYMSVLLKAAHTHGTYQDRTALTLAVIDRNLGITERLADRICKSLCEVGLVTETDFGLVISDWDLYEPPQNALSPSQRQSRRDHTAHVIEKGTD